MNISPCKTGELIMTEGIPVFSQKVLQQGESCLEGQECRPVTQHASQNAKSSKLLKHNI